MVFGALSSGIFFSAVYTESSYILFSVAGLYFARRGRWGAAALYGTLAAATRVTGVALLGVVGLEWLRQHGWTLGTCYQRAAWRNFGRALRDNVRSLAIFCFIPLGLISYLLFLGHYFADPLAFMTVQSIWDREQLGQHAS